MEWYYYLSYYGAGLFVMNAVPHLVAAVTGRRFPSPFARPRGKGLSRPVVNAGWGLANLFVGALLAQLEGHPFINWISNLCFFGGVAVMAVALSVWFERHGKEEDHD